MADRTPQPDGRAPVIAALVALAFGWAEFKERDLVAGTKAARQANAKWTVAVESWAKLVAARGDAGALDETVVRDGEAEAHARLRSAAADARLADRFAASAASDKARLATDR